MRDIMMLLLIAAFFALCVAYVYWCDRIIGPDPDVPTADGDEAPLDRVDEAVTA
jgi:hypothetical protein